MSAMKLEIEGSMDGHSGGSGEEGSSEGKAPSDFLAECLSATLRRSYGTALRYCRLILRHEPQHRAAMALLPTLRTRAAATATDTTLEEEDAPAKNIGDSSESATDSCYSAGDNGERRRSESLRSDPSRLEQSLSESEPNRLEQSSDDAASDSASELDLESELEDLDTYTSTSVSSSHEVSDSSGGGGGAECDDNGNCTVPGPPGGDHNHNAPLPVDTHTLPLSHPHWPRDMHPIALDNDLRSIKDYQLRKSCAH